jgi:hypothetical protein
MNAVVKTIFSPDVAAMREHVEHLFGGYLDGYHDGLIELSWTDTSPDPSGRYRLAHARLFGTDRLDDLVQEAARLNATPMCNVYIGAALRHPNTAPFGRGQDRDAWALTSAYVDLDDAEAAANAKNIYGLDKPTMVVLTGTEPHTRAQLWWRLAEPLTDPAHWPALLRGIAAKMDGDSTVTNPSRVMRLAGTIAWPVKQGRKVELTAIHPLREPGRCQYAVEHLARVFPPVGIAAAAAQATELSHTTNSLGLADKIDDGRERYMVKTIMACLIEMIGQTGCCPTPQELYDAAWPQYERKVSFQRPGRGPEEFAEKCRYTVQRFEAGRIGGLETLGKASEIYRHKAAERPKPHQPTPLPPPATNKPLILSSAEFVAGFRPPEYLIDGVIQQSYLYSLTARTGHGKTAVGMFMAQAVARGQSFHGHATKQGAVLFLAGENPDDVRARYLILADYHRFDPLTTPIHFIDGVVDIAACLPRIREEAARIENLALVIVDTAAAYFRGDDGNSNSQQGDFARLLRQLTFLPGKPACVVPCHPIKNASKENLSPVGGGAFLNEVDGNLTIWSNAEKHASMHWQGKFRGPEFEPMPFEMRVVESDRVTDANGVVMPSVVAVPISDLAVERTEADQESDENLIMKIVAASPRASLRHIAEVAKFSKGKVERIFHRLTEDKLMSKHRGGKYRLTDKGKKELGISVDAD